MQLVEPGAHPGEVGDACEDAGGVGPGLLAAPGHRVGDPGPVCPPVVLLVAGLGVPVGVVGQSELVAAPDHRHPAPARDDRVGEQHPGHRTLRVAALLPEAGQRRGGAADAPVAGGGVLLEDQPLGRRPRIVAGVVVGQEPSVGPAVQTDGVGVTVVDGPADVVVAAHVGDPGAGRRRARERGQGVAGQHGAAGGQHRPDLHHEAVVVGQFADPTGVTTRAEVADEVAWPDDRLGLEERRRGGKPGHRAQRLGDRMHLGLILAAGAHPLPQERDRVEAQHLHSEVGQEQHDLGELREHIGVGPVEVPLIGVEGRPDPGVQVVVEGEVAGREVGEDLEEGAFVGVGP